VVVENASVPAPKSRFSTLRKKPLLTVPPLSLVKCEKRDRRVAKSLEIAWDYLEAMGELGNPDRAAEHLLDSIEGMIRQGERRPLLLSNKAIACYQRF
jgi:hypothetical protein